MKNYNENQKGMDKTGKTKDDLRKSSTILPGDKRKSDLGSTEHDKFGQNPRDGRK